MPDTTIATPYSQDILIGSEIAGRYQIISLIGAGGMSVVYKARHKFMESTVAIKMLNPYLVASEQALKRFQQEAQVASNLSHPNIMGVRDFGISSAGQPFLVMDYLEGKGLSELIAELGPIPWRRAVNIFIQACDALSHAHENKVIHRDLKPSNIMLIDLPQQKDCVKLVDFGIAKLLSQSQQQGQHLTATGEVFGSPLYMSPEQCLSGNLDTRSDVYSLGCVFYEALTGRAPLAGANMLETMYLHVNEPPLPFNKVRSGLSIPYELEEIVFKMLEKTAVNRQQSMFALKEELKNLAGGARGRKAFLGRLRKAVSVRRKVGSKRLNSRKIIFIIAAAVLAGSALTWMATSLQRVRQQWSAYGAEPFFVSYREPEAPPLDEATASKDETLLLGLMLLKRVEYGANNPNLAEIYLRLGKFYRRQVRRRQAIDYYKSAYNCLKAHLVSDKDRLMFDEISRGLSELYCLQGLYSQAEPIVEAALKNYAADSAEPELPVLKMTLAYCYYRQGKLDDALLMLRQAADIWTGSIEDHQSAAIAYMDMAEIFKQKQDYRQAAEKYKLAEQFKEEAASNNTDLPRYLLTLAWLYELSGDCKQAEQLCDRAGQISSELKGGNSQEMAVILNRKADLLWQTNHWLASAFLKVQALVMK